MPSRLVMPPCSSFGSEDTAAAGAAAGLWLAQLSAPVAAFFVRHRHRLIYLHTFMFVLFIVVIGGPLLLPDPPGDATPLNNLRVAANFALWGHLVPDRVPVSDLHRPVLVRPLVPDGGRVRMGQ
ncbi:MAG: hypothetical protein WAM17_09300 [Rhodoplanes sp.]